MEERFAEWNRVEGLDEDCGELLEFELFADKNCRSFWLLVVEATLPPAVLGPPPAPPPPEDDDVIVVSKFFRSFQQDSDSKICERRRESTSSPMNIASQCTHDGDLFTRIKSPFYRFFMFTCRNSISHNNTKISRTVALFKDYLSRDY